MVRLHEGRIRYRIDENECCPTLKHAVKRKHMMCVEHLLDCQCEWWEDAVWYCICSHDREWFEYVIAKGAPIHSGFFFNALYCHEIEMAERVVELGARYKKWRLVEDVLLDEYITEPIDIYKISIESIVSPEYIQEVRWVFNHPGIKIGTAEAERAARKGMYWILERYFNQKEGVNGGKIARTKRMVRNAYRSGNVKCLSYLLEQKCPVIQEILYLETNVECFKLMLDRVEDWGHDYMDVYFCPLTDAILRCFYYKQDQLECLEALIRSNKLRTHDLQCMIDQIEWSSKIRTNTRSISHTIADLPTTLDKLAMGSVYLCEDPRVTEWLVQQGANLNYAEIEIGAISHPKMVQWVSSQGAVVTVQDIHELVSNGAIQSGWMAIYEYYRTRENKPRDPSVRMGHYWIVDLMETLSCRLRNQNSRNQVRVWMYEQEEIIQWMLCPQNELTTGLSAVYRKDWNRILHMMRKVYGKLVKIREQVNEALVEKGLYKDLLFEITKFLC